MNYTICLNANILNDEELNEQYKTRRIYWDWCILSAELEENIVFKTVRTTDENGEDNTKTINERLAEIFALISTDTTWNIIVSHEEAKAVIKYYEEQEAINWIQ